MLSCHDVCVKSPPSTAVKCEFKSRWFKKPELDSSHITWTITECVPFHCRIGGRFSLANESHTNTLVSSLTTHYSLYKIQKADLDGTSESLIRRILQFVRASTLSELSPALKKSSSKCFMLYKITAPSGLSWLLFHTLKLWFDVCDPPP